MLLARKFKCRQISCSQKTFTERFSFIDSYARLSNNIIEIIKLLGLLTSAEKVSIIMHKLGINISHETIIRILWRLPENLIEIDETVTNIGADDLVFKKR